MARIDFNREVAAGRTVSRREAKLRTRRRLLEAARTMILAGDESDLTASTVARQAGVGGATFYEHFANREELLRALSEQLFDELRGKLANRREEALAAPNDEAMLRQEFRTPLELIAASPDLFRLALRVRHRPGSPLGDSSRRHTGNTRRDVVAELIARGYPAATPGERRRLEMIADVHIAATEALALGHISGRYPDLDELADILVLMTRGTRLVRAWRARGPGPAP
ncbi:MAG TPA: TetR/AcrR family transcriptional regulator [Candidatus Dormibacteraeota bacterium]|jgi:AcrR family transcriptional regulator